MDRKCVISLIVDLLAVIDQCYPRLNKAKDKKSEGDILPGMYMARDAIHLLAVLAYHHPGVQSLIGQGNGIFLILNHTGIDDRNPCMSLRVAVINNG